MSAAIAVGWAGLVLVVASRRARLPLSRGAGDSGGSRRRPHHRGGGAVTDAIAHLGMLVQRRIPPTRAVGPATTGTAVLAAGLAAIVDPLAGLVLAIASVIACVASKIAATRARRARLARELPAALEVLTMASAAGMTLPVALAMAVDELDGEVGVVLGDVMRRHAHGVGLADALADVARREGEPLEPVLSMLATSLHSGAPVSDALARAADRQRRVARRDAETRIRRLPVSLLVPLVCCVMPAFVLVTIVPVIAGGTGRVELP